MSRIDVVKIRDMITVSVVKQLKQVSGVNFFSSFRKAKAWKLKAILMMLVIPTPNGLFAQQVFEVNLNDRADDKFHVTVYPEKLSSENNIFQFATKHIINCYMF